MSFKLSLLTFAFIGSFSSFAMAEDSATNKTCSGNAWISSKDASAPEEVSFTMVRAAGNSEGDLTMAVLGISAVGSYSATDDRLKATFNVENDGLLVSGNITQLDDETIAVTGTLTYGDNEPLNLLALDLKCSNN